jgi:hypothetical protein
MSNWTKGSIKIVHGKQGYHLQVNGFFIRKSVDVMAVITEFNSPPHGATEWVSVKAIREFWKDYRILAIDATRRPYKSVWGSFIPTV